MCVDFLRDVQASDLSCQVATLRYFNPADSHISGTNGEHPNDIPNILMPFTQVAVSKWEFLGLSGSDCPTPDGTGVRDYRHIVDLPQRHLATLRYLKARQQSITENPGIGRGGSVKELAYTFSSVNAVGVLSQFFDRRPGDMASCYADPTLAQHELGQRAPLNVDRIWRRHSMNPDGFC